MAHWTKEQLIKIAKFKTYEFVESLKEVEEYFTQKKYGIAKDSTELREVLKENLFPVNKEFSNLQKGYYYIIDIAPKTSEFKSQTKTANIAYALYKENKIDTYGDKVLQININTLLNGNSKTLFADENISRADLIGNTIQVTAIKDGNDETKSRQAVFTGVEIFSTPEEIAKHNVPPTEEDLIFEYQLMKHEQDERDNAMYQPQYETLEFWDENDPTMYMDF